MKALIVIISMISMISVANGFEQYDNGWNGGHPVVKQVPMIYSPSSSSSSSSSSSLVGINETCSRSTAFSFTSIGFGVDSIDNVPTDCQSRYDTKHD